MKAALIAALLSSCMFLFALSIAPAASGQGPRPGDMSPANVWIQNRSPDEAIPVRVLDTGQSLRVQITGITPTRVDNVVATRPSRQAWEYTEVRIGTDQDAPAVLNKVGADGWETTGLQFETSKGTTVVLKRPR